jgi:hypothetical protein
MRRQWMAWAGTAGLLLGHPMIAHGTSSGGPTAADRQRFAAATQVPADSLRSLRQVPVPAGVALDALWLGIADVAGDPQPWLLGIPPGKAQPVALRLPLASEVGLLAVIDATGRPLRMDLLGARDIPAASAPANGGPGGVPMLLMRAAHRLDSGEQRETLLLVQLAPSPRLVWREVATSMRTVGDSFRSFALEFVTDPGSKWLAIELFQTTLPPAGQQPAMPGPPLRLRFGYRDGAYQRLG